MENPAPASHGLVATSWAVMTNPYVISAVACGALALALSYFLSAGPAPRDAKRRVVAGDVRRVGNAQFVFRSPTEQLPDLLLDAAAGRIIALHSKKRNGEGTSPPTLADDEAQSRSRDTPRVSRAPRISISIPLRSGLFCRDDFREQVLADVDDLRVLDRGLHFQDGRAVSVALGPEEQETVLQFNSRVGVEAFLDVLYNVKSKRLRRPDNVSMFLTTFNVGNAQPPDDLSPWLSQAASADIIAIGAQECSYTATNSPAGPPVCRNFSASTATKVITEATPLLEGDSDSEGDVTRSSSAPKPIRTQSATGTSGKEHWHSLLASHFPEDEYACIAKLSAWDRCLNIFVRRNLLSAVSRVRHDTANVGLGGVAGNKGAIGARFTVFDTDFVIINSHLAAHSSEVNRRNEDFASIANGLRNLRDNQDVDIVASAVHHLFWMGDLNYRIDLERDKTLELIKERNWEQLNEADQLTQEMKAGRAFQGFLEGKTDFPPTYRYERGSREYSAVKLRVPSYCDRILYRSLPGCKLELHEYKPADEIQTSDHSPVVGVFIATLIHTSGTRDLETIATDTSFQEARDLGLLSPLVSPRSLSLQALLPSGLPGFSGTSGIQLQFKRLSATDIPEMDHGGRRIAVAKALHIHNHVGWKKHEELGAGQHADPYCTFHGDAVAELDEGEYRTRTIMASQNPVWEPDAIPGIDLISTAGAAIKRRYVVITVRDEIPTRRDDTIGSAVLWLGGSETGDMTTGDEPVAFSLPITLAGRKQGDILGSYIIKKT